MVRTLTEEERQALEQGLRSPEAFVVRRCQMLLARARGERAPRLAEQVGCDDQTVRAAGQACTATGRACLQKGASRAHHTRLVFGPEQAERLRARLHRSPRDLGQPTRVWRLAVAAPVRGAAGLIATCVSGETSRHTRLRLGSRWERATHGSTSPDPAYARQTGGVTAGSRERGSSRTGSWAVPRRPGGAGWRAPRCRRGRTPPRGRGGGSSRNCPRLMPIPRPWPALACCGAKGGQDAPLDERVWRRFVAGRPLRAITDPFLAWGGTRRHEAGVRVWVLRWDHASWHVSKRVRAWSRTPNRLVKQRGQGVRIVSCSLPSKRPWLKPLEATGVHRKRAIVEPTRLLSAPELADRVCAYVGCSHEPHLTIPDKVA